MGNGKMFEKRLFWSAQVESETALMRNQQAFPDILLKESTQHTGFYSNERKVLIVSNKVVYRGKQIREVIGRRTKPHVFLPKQVGWKIGDEKAILSITEIHLEQ